jgi:hypothetical protein
MADINKRALPLPAGMPMNGLRRNDAAMKNCCWYKKMPLRHRYTVNTFSVLFLCFSESVAMLLRASAQACH